MLQNCNYFNRRIFFIFLLYRYSLFSIVRYFEHTMYLSYTSVHCVSSRGANSLLFVRFSESQPQDTLREEAPGTFQGVFSFFSCLVSNANDFLSAYIFFVFTLDYIYMRWKSIIDFIE